MLAHWGGGGKGTYPAAEHQSGTERPAGVQSEGRGGLHSASVHRIVSLSEQIVNSGGLAGGREKVHAADSGRTAAL